MRRRLARLRSVSAKVTWIAVVVSASAVLIVSVLAGVRSYRYMQQQTLEKVALQAQIVAMNAGAPLAFGDREMAVETLAAFRVVEGVERALLVNRQGTIYASYPALPAASLQGPLYPVGRWPHRNGYALVFGVSDQAGEHGRLQVEVRHSPLRRSAMMTALLAALTSLVAIALAWWLARRLHPLLTAPVLELHRAMQRVRDSGDYSVRVARTSDDELGHLTDAFNEMLERIDASQRQLIAARRQAEESSRLKDEFVATVSHELRTPLSPIVAWVHMLRLPQGAQKLHAGLDVMERNARALAAIIDDLLDMSRIVSGTLRLALQPLDVNSAVRAAMETLEPTARLNHVTLQARLVPEAPVLGDAARLQQVVWNLLSNAIKFSAGGSEVQVRTETGDGQVRIVVSDRGVGISPEFLPHVFDRFRQQDGSITRRHGGLGLGLSIVRQLVELHGGSVRAESAGSGQGTTMTVTLPAAEPRSAVPAPATATADPDEPGRALAGLTVLLVEDHADTRQILHDILGGAGARIVEACSAEEALAVFGETPPHLLVSDIGLPDIDGRELLQRLRSTFPGAARLPAIAVSAYVRPEEKQRAREAGFRFYLSKPVDPSALVAAAAAAVGR